AVPGLGKFDASSTLRLRVQDDDRISFAARYALVTLDGAGKILHRAMLPVRRQQEYAIVPLPGGDFLIQANAAGFGAMRLGRYAADGRARFTNTEPLHPEINSILHDATLLPDGRIAAVASLGVGPNDTLALVVFDAAGRRIADHRMALFLPAMSFSARI